MNVAKLSAVGLGLIVVIALMGCSKKAPPDQSKVSSPAPQTVKSAKQDSADIFDEFYKEESANGSAKTSHTAKAEKPARSKTRKATASAESFASSSSYTPRFSETGRYVVQVTTLRSKVLADELVARLTGKGYPAYDVEVQSPTSALSGTWYRVRVGSFSSIPEAREFGENVLKPSNYDYWVDKKINDNAGVEGKVQSEPSGSSAPAQEVPPEAPDAHAKPAKLHKSSSVEPSAASPAEAKAAVEPAAEKSSPAPASTPAPAASPAPAPARATAPVAPPAPQAATPPPASSVTAEKTTTISTTSDKTATKTEVTTTPAPATATPAAATPSATTGTVKTSGSSNDTWGSDSSGW